MFLKYNSNDIFNVIHKHIWKKPNPCLEVLLMFILLVAFIFLNEAIVWFQFHKLVTIAVLHIPIWTKHGQRDSARAKCYSTVCVALWLNLFFPSITYTIKSRISSLLYLKVSISIQPRHSYLFSFISLLKLKKIFL